MCVDLGQPYKLFQNRCKYQLLVILTKYKDLYAKVHEVTFLTYSKRKTNWIFVIYGKFYPKSIYNLCMLKFI